MIADEDMISEALVTGDKMSAMAIDGGFAAGVFLMFAAPAPNVAEPESRQYMDTGGDRSPVGHRDTPQQVIGRALGDFLHHIEVAAIFEDSHVGQFKLGFLAAQLPGFLDNFGIGILRMRIFVEGLGVGMGGGGIEIVITLFDILAVVTLMASKTKEALLENGIAPIPEGGREVESALTITPTAETIFTPAVGATTGMIMREG